MNDQEIKTLQQTIVASSIYYGRQLPDMVISMYVDGLREFSLDQNIVAIKHYMMNQKNRTMFLVADIASIIKPQPSEKDLAVDLARKIEKSVRRHQESWLDGVFMNGERMYEGWNKIFTDWESAVAYELGDLGLLLVKRYGWIRLCQDYFEMDPGQFHSQLRDTIVSVMSIAKAGMLDSNLQIPSAPQERLESVVKSLAESKKLE